MGKGEIAFYKEFLLFPQCFFHPFGELSTIFIKSELVVCQLFQVGPVQNIVVWERVKSSCLNMQMSFCINSSPINNILDWSKFKTFADNNSKVNQKLKFALCRVGNTVGKGENAGYHHFLFFQQFSKGFFFRVVKCRDCVVKS